MAGETDPSILLRQMQPELNEGEFVYCIVDSKERAADLDPVCTCSEKEGVTVIVPRQKADKEVLSYPIVCA